MRVPDQLPAFQQRVRDRVALITRCSTASLLMFSPRTSREHPAGVSDLRL